MASNSNRPPMPTPSVRVLATKPPIEGQPNQLNLGLEVERDIDGIGMGILSDGTPYLNQRGLAKLCGVENAHIGSISAQWQELEQKPRIQKIKSLFMRDELIPDMPHIEVRVNGRVHFCYPADVCLAIMEYYAFEAGKQCQTEARDNYRRLAGSNLQDLIYRQLGFDKNGKPIVNLDPWLERVALNHQSAPKGYFSVFNETHTLIYELIQGGAKVGPKLVPDISVGQHWARHWSENELDLRFGPRLKYPHAYPKSHPQADSNPQEAWCYPDSGLAYYRKWLAETYVGGGSLETYLKSKVAAGLVLQTRVNELVQRISAESR